MKAKEDGLDLDARIPKVFNKNNMKVRGHWAFSPWACTPDQHSRVPHLVYGIMSYRSASAVMVTLC